MKKCVVLPLLISVILASPLYLAAQEDQTEGDIASETQSDTQNARDEGAEQSGGGASPGGDGPFGFGMGIAFGVNSFENSSTNDVETYQFIGLRPDFSFGRFGVGLDLTVNYRFTGGDDGDEFEIRDEDWEPDDETSFLELYLPKFRYIRYGQKGDDLFARFGSFSDSTLGNGFIVSNYSNELFLPERRIFGGNFDLDGQLFGVPYFGFETLVSNVAAWDLMAGRLYVRPLASLDVPLLPALQIGSTVAVDRDPFYFEERDPASVYYTEADPRVSTPSDEILVWGLDVRQPILATDLISLAAFSDVANQDGRWGGMVGAGGRISGFLLYGAQIRMLEDNFVPNFFDSTYDRRRLERYQIYEEQVETDGGVGWLARIGFAFLADSLVFDTTVSGPFDASSGRYPELHSSLLLAEGVVPGFSGLSFQANYDKFNLREYEDLWDAKDSLIGARINIRSGPIVISLLYNLTYDPNADGDPWTVTSGLESTISF